MKYFIYPQQSLYITLIHYDIVVHYVPLWNISILYINNNLREFIRSHNIRYMRSFGQIWSLNFNRAFFIRRSWIWPTKKLCKFEVLYLSTLLLSISLTINVFHCPQPVPQSNRKMFLLIISIWQIKLLVLGWIDNARRFPMGP